MSETQRPHERWIWTELIGFDNRDPDLGVQTYIDTAGFVPHAICLLVTSPDFILSHEDRDEEVDLPPDFCSRDGHVHNPVRQRQVWTNHDVRRLIDELHRHGTQAYLTVFTRFYGNKFHHEWVSDHREVCMVRRSHGWVSAINSLSRLDDGTYYEDYFIQQLVQVLNHYGFDGWHGADGYGPLSGAVYDLCFSDNMVAQFAESSGLDLPPVVTESCENVVEKVDARADWIWQNARHEWIGFYADRWTQFWSKVMTTLHQAGKKAVINSAWANAPFESLYRYGIDYPKIADTGVDGIVVETVGASTAMDDRPGATDPARHYDFLSMLMLIKAYVPDAKLIFLNTTHDVVEEWNAIHHVPLILERETYSLANVFHTDARGDLVPCSDGFLVCLGDGMSREDWAWMRDRWRLAFSSVPRRTLGATLVWSDAAFMNQVEDFTRTRAWTMDRLLFELMARGAPVQSTVKVDSLHNVDGTLLVLNSHLFPRAEIEKIQAYSNGPVVMVGRSDRAPEQLRCHVQGAPGVRVPEAGSYGPDEVQGEVMATAEPSLFWNHLVCRGVSDGFLKGCVDALLQAAGCFSVVEEGDSVAVMAVEQRENVLRLAVKNKTPQYARPQLDVQAPIESVEVLTKFPSMLVRPEGSTFRVRVPGNGIVVLDVALAK